MMYNKGTHKYTIKGIHDQFVLLLTEDPKLCTIIPSWTWPKSKVLQVQRERERERERERGSIRWMDGEEYILAQSHLHAKCYYTWARNTFLPLCLLDKMH